MRWVKFEFIYSYKVLKCDDKIHSKTLNIIYYVLKTSKYSFNKL